MIDLHCHVLFGIDDGPEIIEESVVIARTALAAGTQTMVATPHVSRRYPNEPETIERVTQRLRARLAEEAIALELRAGAEVALSRARAMEPRELERLSLGGGPWVLVEPPFRPVAQDLHSGFRELLERGHRVVVAHPERCAAFQRDRGELRELVQAGCLASLTAGSLTGRFGETVRRCALTLLREGLAHNVASDAHDRYARPPGALEQIQLAGAGELAQWLTVAVPTAILAGDEIPPRPSVELPAGERARRWAWRGPRLARARQGRPTPPA